MLFLWESLGVFTASLYGTAFRLSLTEPDPLAETFVQYPLLLANVVGCFVLGFISASMKESLPIISVAISVGFCGCLTSFSGWIVSFTKNHWVELFWGLSIPFTAISVGYDVSKNIQLSKCDFKKFERPLILFITFCSIVIIASIAGSGCVKEKYLLSLAFSPLASIMRFSLGRALNHRYPSFPVGTFTSNMIATIIARALYSTQDTAVTYGIVRGFCGSLSTVSGWAQEVMSLRASGMYLKSYFYCFLSVGVAAALSFATGAIAH